MKKLRKALFTGVSRKIELKEIPVPTIENQQMPCLRFERPLFVNRFGICMVNPTLVSPVQFLLGHEGVGIIETVGDGVPEVKKETM
jgi:NADPH:quinone reductase-like Zn-dependent oxidoreductase